MPGDARCRRASARCVCMMARGVSIWCDASAVNLWIAPTEPSRRCSRALSATAGARASLGTLCRFKGSNDKASCMRRALGRRRSIVVNFARWEIGLAMAPGNPLAIRGFADLARPGLRIVNREAGSGARSALDEALADQNLKPDSIAGYEVEAGGHLDVASAIAAGLADVGVTIRLGADAFGLHFIPYRDERYDLVIMETEVESAP